MNLINDTLNLVFPPEWSAEGSKHGANTCIAKKVGFYNLVYDEAVSKEIPDMIVSKDKKPPLSKGVQPKGYSSNLWKWYLARLKSL